MPVPEVPVRQRDAEGARHRAPRHIDRDHAAVARADPPERLLVLRELERPRRRRSVVTGSRQVDAARLRGLQVERVDHRAAVLTDVEREQVPAVGRREPRVRRAPDDPGLVRILQRRGLQPARADVGETHLIAARLQIADEEQVVAPERVEVPLASGNRDVALLPALRDDRERRPARAQPPDDRAAPVLRDARERPSLCQVGTSDLRPERSRRTRRAFRRSGGRAGCLRSRRRAGSSASCRSAGRRP